MPPLPLEAGADKLFEHAATHVQRCVPRSALEKIDARIHVPEQGRVGQLRVCDWILFRPVTFQPLESPVAMRKCHKALYISSTAHALCETRRSHEGTRDSSRMKG